MTILLRAAAFVGALVVSFAVATSLQGQAGQPPPPAASLDGHQLFKTYCASCHGENGHGNGPAADSLRHVPPDLARYSMKNGGVFPAERLARIVDGRDIPSHGNREMPVWGDAFREMPDGVSADMVKARITAIIKYLELLQARNGNE
jgi:mono/diheme cytochrome c family protein